jgi:2,3-bisphosphoglycerate-independent phosphoglycerate mutase
MSRIPSKKVILIILDGFGHREETKHNAIALAQTPNYSRWIKDCPHSLIHTSGEAVGLPPGIMGNSEVGHLSIGSGRVILQEMTRISRFAEVSGFESLPHFKRVFSEKTGNLHFMGLVSDGGVHSDVAHLRGMIEAAGRYAPKKNIFIHVITDGRDTPPDSGLKFVSDLEAFVKTWPNVKIATVSGRFYPMDRDQRWDRLKIGYDALTVDSGPKFKTAVEAVKDAYSKGETDEFIKPRLIEGGQRIAKDDQMVFFNFRADRAREISMAFGVDDFKEFPTPVKVDPKNWVTFTRYREDFPFPYLFSPQKHKRILGELVSEAGYPQLRIAETEKYAHVTYFFNGGEETEFPMEERVLIPSPKEVATYDLKPEMSAKIVTNEVIRRLTAKDYGLVVINFANGDMVGHTGNESAAIEAVNVIDECLGEIVKKAEKKGYDVLITADHGNCEEMVDKRGGPMTQHTLNPVPAVLISPRYAGKKLRDGSLSDIAPTILELLGIEKPSEMSGRSLIV